MLRYLLIRSGLAGLVLVLAGGGAEGAQEYTAQLSGFSELGALNAETGAILTNGTGRLRLDVDQNSATYSLTYSGLTSKRTAGASPFRQGARAGRDLCVFVHQPG